MPFHRIQGEMMRCIVPEDREVWRHGSEQLFVSRGDSDFRDVGEVVVVPPPFGTKTSWRVVSLSELPCQRPIALLLGQRRLWRA